MLLDVGSEGLMPPPNTHTMTELNTVCIFFRANMDSDKRRQNRLAFLQRKFECLNYRIGLSRRFNFRKLKVLILLLFTT